MHKVINSICIGCGHLAQETITTICCPDSKYVTIQEYLKKERSFIRKFAETFKDKLRLEAENKELKEKVEEQDEEYSQLEKEHMGLVDELEELQATIQRVKDSLMSDEELLKYKTDIEIGAIKQRNKTLKELKE